MKANAWNVFWGQLRRSVFGLSTDAVSFKRRGFQGADTGMQNYLASICHAFLSGYHFSLEASSSGALDSKLAGVELDLRGFAYEGAAMGLALRERVTPWNSKLINTFLSGHGDAHCYMIHVGIGWVWARMPLGFRRSQNKLDPLLGWLAYDGWGFHEGFFHWPKYIAGQSAPKKLIGYERRAFDQGLGRSFWFVNGGNVEMIAQTLAKFSVSRQADLWSGIGLAATYAGKISEASLHQLRELAGSFQPQLAQGAAFAAKARQRADNQTDYTDLAATVFCELSAEAAAHCTDEALEKLPADAAVPAYEVWRQRIQNHFADKLQLQASL